MNQLELRQCGLDFVGDEREALGVPACYLSVIMTGVFQLLRGSVMSTQFPAYRPVMSIFSKPPSLKPQFSGQHTVAGETYEVPEAVEAQVAKVHRLVINGICGYRKRKKKTGSILENAYEVAPGKYITTAHDLNDLDPKKNRLLKYRQRFTVLLNTLQISHAELLIREKFEPTEGIPVVLKYKDLKRDLAMFTLSGQNPFVLPRVEQPAAIGDTVYIVTYWPNFDKPEIIPAVVKKIEQHTVNRGLFREVTPGYLLFSEVIKACGQNTVGMSGSPVFNRHGDFVGIHVAGERLQPKTPIEGVAPKANGFLYANYKGIA